MMCDLICGREGSMYCMICENENMFITQEENEQLEMMCDLMCGKVEEND